MASTNFILLALVASVAIVLLIRMLVSSMRNYRTSVWQAMEDWAGQNNCRILCTWNASLKERWLLQAWNFQDVYGVQFTYKGNNYTAYFIFFGLPQGFNKFEYSVRYVGSFDYSMPEDPEEKGRVKS